jgi:hypothetical protein
MTAKQLRLTAGKAVGGVTKFSLFDSAQLVERILSEAGD